MHDGWLLLFLGVRTCQDEAFNLRQYLHTNFDCKTDNVICLVAGIRPVKDPLYLVKEFAGMLRRRKSLFHRCCAHIYGWRGGSQFENGGNCSQLTHLQKSETIQRSHSFTVC